MPLVPRPLPVWLSLLLVSVVVVSCSDGSSAPLGGDYPGAGTGGRAIDNPGGTGGLSGSGGAPSSGGGFPGGMSGSGGSGSLGSGSATGATGTGGFASGAGGAFYRSGGATAGPPPAGTGGSSGYAGASGTGAALGNGGLSGAGGTVGGGSGGTVGAGSGGAVAAGSGGAVGAGSGGAVGAGGGAGSLGSGAGGSSAGQGGRGGAAASTGRCPAGAIFCADFESGTIPAQALFFPEYLRPQLSTYVTVEAGGGLNGGRAARFAGTSFSQMLGVATGTATFWTRVYLRMDIDVSTVTGHGTYLLATDGNGDPNVGEQIRVGEHTCQLELNRRSDDKELLSNGGTYSCDGGIAFARNSWYCLETFFDGPGRQVRVFVNGTESTALKADWGPYNYGMFKFGFEKYSSPSRTIWYDDVAVAAQRVGCY